MIPAIVVFIYLALSSLLSGVFIWRASVSWMAVASGQSAKLTAAVLITAMGLASIAMIVGSIRALIRAATIAKHSSTHGIHHRSQPAH